MRRPGFTLIELQTAHFLGFTVLLLAGLLLFYETERQIRVDREVKLRLALTRVDATLQWQLWRAESVSIAPQKITIDLRDETWAFGGDGVFADGIDQFTGEPTLRLIDTEIRDDTLVASFTATIGEQATTARFQYYLPSGSAP
ncbi:hypothetical protein SCOR_30140 [Sulfidibacter corallicola]|uniref:Uncharacterized protein n=1 Tax=Sulfidibacter corallicola TaxID=2818388 RepID=A0A8A4TKS9_SULCO|nr:hypothetical protein [Sulfidibacter corallicola]QTD50183.1 hypothetical protein J3U87_31750 [Sulfidibacter corallicola]